MRRPRPQQGTGETMDPISATLALARAVSDDDIAATHREIDDLDRRLAALLEVQEVEELFAIEKVAKERVDTEIKALRSRRSDRLAKVQRPDYRLMPTEALIGALSMRTEEGWPRLALFSIASSTVAIKPKDQFRGSPVEPSLPDPVKQCYDDVVAKVEALPPAQAGSRNVLIATFPTLIPTEVRRKVAAAKRVFKSVHILAEVERWQHREEEIPQLAQDPLVIGFDGQSFWLIASFDLTPLEDAIQQICEGSAPKA
ncbi:hypothetical protein HY634_02310 [Candidatus Uhrbacteria bacterium]|nr:hypothetical protein [Candidatus Uhrbacteria bacterium]